ncbi:hypothetical protein T484DRAFT_1744236 [Baffinella frigidus]|nr:hypothetical protein T484DRAFT_1744236 [Cryptophyta sp. CCMP2293]
MAPSGKSRGARGAELLEGLLDDENATESPSNPLRASARSFYKKEKNSGGGQQDAGEAADGAKTGKVARFAENDDVEEGDEAGQAAEGSGPSGSGGWKSAEAMEQSGGGNFEERKFHLPVWMLKQRQGGEDGYINLESLDCDEANTPFNVDTKRALKDTVNQSAPAHASSPWPRPRSRPHAAPCCAVRVRGPALVGFAGYDFLG